MKTRVFITPIAALLFSSFAAYAQLAGEFNPPRANCCLANTAKSLADQLQDWNQLGRYYTTNRELQKQPPDPKRVVFIGDSPGCQLITYPFLCNSDATNPHATRFVRFCIAASGLIVTVAQRLGQKPEVRERGTIPPQGW